MRILYIHQFFATRDSAHPTRSYEFARRMVEDGHDVVMVTGASRLEAPWDRRIFGRFEVDGIDVRSVKNAYSNHMGYGRRMLSFAMFTILGTITALRAPKPDVVFATSTPLTAGIPGYVASRLRRVRFVFEVRDLWPEAAIQMGAVRRGSLLAKSAKALERFLYRKADAIVALSPGMADGVFAESTPFAKVHTIPNCSDLDLFHPGEKDPDIVARYDLRGRFVVGYAGAIGPSNGLEVVVETGAILAERGRDDIVFLLAGDGKSVPALNALIEEKGLRNVLLLGSLPKSEVPSLLRTTDLLMTLFANVPILATNSPNKFFDGLASGRPMLVNSPGWTRDLVEESSVGVFVPPGDAVAMADAVMRLADDPDTVRDMGRRARGLAEDRFDREDMAQRLIGVLASVARQG